MTARLRIQAAPSSPFRNALTQNRPHTAPHRILVIGNGMVSRHFVNELSKRSASGSFAITIVGEEPRPAYDRVHLTDYFSKRDPAALSLGDSAWYSERGCALITGRRAISIDRTVKSVRDDAGGEHFYDSLVLACGSRPFIPPMEGATSPGVFVYRTIEDAEAIMEHARSKRSALVLGGGLLGLEAANAVRGMGLATTVAEFASGLMPRQLNETGSRILENEIRRLGVTLLLGKGAQRIEELAGRLEVTFNDGATLRTNLVIVATGVRPRDELAASAGLALGARGGILIDDTLRTDDESIFAIGECALHRGQIYGFVAPGYQMAEVLADRFVGGKRIFEGSDTSCRLKLLGIEVAAFGDYLGEGKTLTYQTADTYRMLVLKRDALIGGTAVGLWNQTHQLQLAVREGRFMPPAEQARFEREGVIEATESVSSWPAHAIVCNCAQITRGALSACIARGCASVELLGKETRAGTICGSCRPLLGQLLGQDGQEAAVPPRGRTGLWIAAIAALAVVAALFAIGPLPAPTTAQSAYYHIADIWKDDASKQISGYTIAGLSVLALGLSARRRFPGLRWGNYGFWRAAHSILGAACLVALLAHTGLSFGDNLNLWLMSSFVGLNLAGSIAALSVAAEDRLSGPMARRIRSIVTKIHILFFWPYPVLLGCHIYAVYRY